MFFLIYKNPFTINDALCQVWLKLIQWGWKKNSKVTNATCIFTVTFSSTYCTVFVVSTANLIVLFAFFIYTIDQCNPSFSREMRGKMYTLCV